MSGKGSGNTFDLLEKGLEELKLPQKFFPRESRSAALDLLKKYIQEIELFNEAYGLVKVKDRDEIIIKHILDSLAPLELLEKNELLNLKIKIADVGSGAGLPGIPLAICLPDTQFTLIERMGRRAGFLRNCAAILGLDNVKTEEIEMEKAGSAEFDIAVFRAFRPLTPEILRGLLRLLKPDGILAAWKGRLENAREEMLEAEKTAAIRWRIVPVKVPFLEEERHLTIIGS
ncbi:MAG: 16S rRNA (guanine(527)-N(7))-methyltransferase RsmG [Treponema sp.]|nr:16S rRNA (guanine(527)-N(7))-methyltransferase RsmG [Treponema sp.]